MSKQPQQNINTLYNDPPALTLLQVGELSVDQWEVMSGSLNSLASVSSTNIVRSRSTTCCACRTICSNRVSVAAISNSECRSAEPGPAARRFRGMPTGAELRLGPSGLIFATWTLRQGWQ